MTTAEFQRPPVHMPPVHHGELDRSIGFWGLMFVSLGSIIGSGWLLGALSAAQVAGGASIIAWVLAALMLSVLALIHAELGTAYPVAGGTARFPYFAFGALAGFTAGWAAYLQAVTIAPIEVEASITYIDGTDWAKQHFQMLNSNFTLNGRGFIVAAVLMVVFTTINLMGAKLLSESNSIMVIWKVFVPALTVVVLIILSFHLHNFSAGGGFFTKGWHGIFAALPVGVVFALQGFEQAVQMAGEARDPQKTVSRAIITAMLVGATIYILLEISFIGALTPSNLAHGWADPLGAPSDSAYYTIALALGAGWLAKILLADAIISPAGTGLIYVGTSSRISYALGEDDVMPNWLTQTSKRHVPIYSILLAFGIGILAFLPFPSWQSLVALVTSATAIMYAFAPISLAALQDRDPDRPRAYHMPWPNVLNPAGFIFANLIIYWSGFEATWKILVGIFFGRVIFEIELRRRDDVHREDVDWRAASWIWPWLIGMTIIGLVGRYGTGSLNDLPNWIDLLVVALFSLVIFYYAVSLAMTSQQVNDAVQTEEEAIAGAPELRTA
jgi:amino acid transporter